MPLGNPHSNDRRRFCAILIFAALAPLAALALLYNWHIPLGCAGRLVYLYSPVSAWRLAATPVAIGIAVVLGLGVWLTGSNTVRRQRAGLALAIFGAVALAFWSYFAPPAHYAQHLFNAQSPSQDGAFSVEATRVTSVRGYLRDFPQRAQTPPQAMRGTRVISNPPGATLLAVGVDRLLQAFPQLGNFALGPAADELPQGEKTAWVQRTEAVGIVFFWTLTGLWLSAGVFFYLAARLFVPSTIALAYSLCCVFSPMTLLFTPGKDPAQLLTVAAPLYFWLLAVQRRRAVWAGLAGVLFVGACLASLVHIWLAALVILATLLGAPPLPPREGAGGGSKRQQLRLLLSASAGALLGAAALYLFCDLNLLATARAVAGAQAAVTRGPNAMPFAWQLLGIPLFALFAGPALWTVALASVSRLGRGPGEVHGDAEQNAKRQRAHTPERARWRFAFRSRDRVAHGGLVILTIAVMLATVGFTNLETPRLWIPFVPLLLLGGILRIEALRQPSRRLALALALLVATQITAAALQWSFMDMRETESRLAEQRYFG